MKNGNQRPETVGVAILDKKFHVNVLKLHALEWFNCGLQIQPASM